MIRSGHSTGISTCNCQQSKHPNAIDLQWYHYPLPKSSSAIFLQQLSPAESLYRNDNEEDKNVVARGRGWGYRQQDTVSYVMSLGRFPRVFLMGKLYIELRDTSLK